MKGQVWHSNRAIFMDSGQKLSTVWGEHQCTDTLGTHGWAWHSACASGVHVRNRSTFITKDKCFSLLGTPGQWGGIVANLQFPSTRADSTLLNTSETILMGKSTKKGELWRGSLARGWAEILATAGSLVAPGIKPQEVGSMSLHRLLHTGGHTGDRGFLHTFSVHREPGHQVRNELPLYSPCPWGFAVFVFLFLSKHEE